MGVAREGWMRVSKMILNPEVLLVSRKADLGSKIFPILDGVVVL